MRWKLYFLTCSKTGSKKIFKLERNFAFKNVNFATEWLKWNNMYSNNQSQRDPKFLFISVAMPGIRKNM